MNYNYRIKIYGIIVTVFLLVAFAFLMFNEDILAFEIENDSQFADNKESSTESITDFTFPLDDNLIFSANTSSNTEINNEISDMSTDFNECDQIENMDNIIENNDYNSVLNGWVEEKIGDEIKWRYFVDGEYLTGMQQIYQDKYLFDENGFRLSGWQNYNSFDYYFDPIIGSLQYGFLDFHNGEIYYLGDEGYKHIGWQDVRGNKCYFSEEGLLQTQWLDQGVNGIYYLGYDGIMRKDWQNIGENRCYFSEEGLLQTQWLDQGVNGIYYLGYDGIMRKDWQNIGENRCYFSEEGILQTQWLDQGVNGIYYLGYDGIMRKDWQNIGENRCYFSEEGILQTQWLDQGMNGIYYLGYDGIMQTGFQIVPAKANNGKEIVAYFEKDGKMHIGTKNVGKITISTDNDGSIVSTEVNGVPYYAQNDPRWAYNVIGGYYFSGTGCLPTVMTSVVNYYFGTSYTPIEVGKVLHYKGYFNTDGLMGTSSDAWLWAMNDYYRKDCKNNLSYNDIVNNLRMGKLIAGAVGPGTFVNPGYTHAILLFGLNDRGQTYVYDPLHSNRNGWYYLSDIYNQRSSAPEDQLGGGPFYAI